MAEIENTWDKLLQIKTTGRDDSNADTYRYPYEPTPYKVLERLANSGFIRKKDVVIDYGCGKGRVDFFLSYQAKARTIGIEYDDRIYQTAVENQKTAASAGRTEFHMENAETFHVPSQADRFYFFNPFSVEILRSVIGRIMESYYEEPREMMLFFYDNSKKIQQVMRSLDGDLVDFLQDLFDGDEPRERIVIFEVTG